MWDRHTDSTGSNRTWVSCLWSGCVTHPGRGLPRAFPLECAAVEESGFFGQTFDAAVAWGLLFLLDPHLQLMLIEKIARVLRAGGQFLFTAPSQSESWRDAMTGHISVSLGHEAYRKALAEKGMSLLGTHRDEGDNHYFDVHKP